MKPFLSLSIPEPLSAEDFTKQTETADLTTDELLDQATKMSATAKRAWEDVSKTTWNVFPKVEDVGTSVLDEKWSTDVKDCLKAAIAASICVLTLKKVKNDEEWKVKAMKEASLPSPGEKGRWHRSWIVPALPPA